MQFQEAMQRALHEVNTWHCPLCGFSDGRELSMKNFTEECILCLYDRVGAPKIEPLCITILIDFKTKRYKRIRKKVQDDK